MKDKEYLLVRECLTNNRKAQTILYNNLRYKLYLITFKYLKNKSEAEEILQEGFIKIFDNLHKFDFKGSFEGWCKKIVARRALDYLRTKNKSILVFDDNTNTEIPEDSYNDFKDISSELIQKSLNKLPENYRTVFKMFAIEGYLHREIALKLNISVGTSKSIYSRSKEKLKKLINI